MQLSFYSMYQIDALLRSINGYLQKLNLSPSLAQPDSLIIHEFLHSQLPKLDDSCTTLVLLDVLHWLWMCNISIHNDCSVFGQNPVVSAAFGSLKRTFTTDSTYLLFTKVPVSSTPLARKYILWITQRAPLSTFVHDPDWLQTEPGKNVALRHLLWFSFAYASHEVVVSHAKSLLAIVQELLQNATNSNHFNLSVQSLPIVHQIVLSSISRSVMQCQTRESNWWKKLSDVTNLFVSQLQLDSLSNCCMIGENVSEYLEMCVLIFTKLLETLKLTYDTLSNSDASKRELFITICPIAETMVKLVRIVALKLKETTQKTQQLSQIPKLMQQAQLLMVFLTFISETYQWSSHDMQDIEFDKSALTQDQPEDVQMDTEFDYLDFVCDGPEHHEETFFVNYSANQQTESEEQTVFLSFKKQK